MTTELTIPRTRADAPPLAARLDEPTGAARESALLFAHGSGVDVDHPWMQAAAASLVSRGFAVLRFRYPYMQLAVDAGKPRPPDRAALLEEAHVDALEELRRRYPRRRWILAGKSLGARMATHIAAQGAHAHALVLYGYPLHPPRKPEATRSEHFATLVQPALFLHGTRDEFGSVEALEQALKRYSGQAELSVVEGADHAFELPAAARRTRDNVLDELAGRVADWEARVFPS
jgi:predicted alpha/beta-hydrolase family hydrolase